MAVTDRYQNFLNTATEKGLLQEFDQPDLELAQKYPEFGTSLLYLKEKYKTSTTDEQKALTQEAANQLRQSYSTKKSGSSGGAFGSTPTGGTIYSDALNSALTGITGSTYKDWKQGDAYRELQADYEAQGQKAMQDTLAQVSARTGGLASSYAGQAAQGSYTDYMRALDEAAYARYQNELGQKMDAYGLLRNAEETEYSRMLDSIELARQEEAQQYERQQAADALSYERQLLEREEARQTVESMLAMGASLADIPSDILAKSGYSENYVNVGSGYYRQQNMPKVSVNATADGENESGIIESMIAYGDDVKAYEYLVRQGFTNGVTEQLWEMYQSEKNRQPDSPAVGVNGAQLGAYAQSISQRLATDYSLNSPEKKAELIRNAYASGLISEDEGYYLMSLY